LALATGLAMGISVVARRPAGAARPIASGRTNRQTPRPGSRRGVARITILRDAGELYQRWQWAEVPTWLPFLDAVTPLGADRVCWAARLPHGGMVRWETDLTVQRGGESLVWQSLPDAAVATHGAIHFAPAPAGRGTEVILAMHFHGPAGLLLARPALAALCEGLRRFKQSAEAGEVATTDGQSSGREPLRVREELRRVVARLQRIECAAGPSAAAAAMGGG